MFHNLRFPTNLRFGNTKVDGGVNQADLEDQVDFVSKQHQQMPFQCFWMHTMCELAPTHIGKGDCSPCMPTNSIASHGQATARATADQFHQPC